MKTIITRISIVAFLTCAPLLAPRARSAPPMEEVALPDTRAGRCAAPALAFVRNCEALIFDIRYNGGASPVMIQLISSYLFEKPTHHNGFYDRAGEKADETWTYEDIPGRRFGRDVPVYVLISNRTFSAAEEFAYNLKHLKRATIIEERSGGGAHPVKMIPVNDRFIMSVPYKRAFNPITKWNWEGTGVIPDIKTSAEDALDAARKAALDRIGEVRRARKSEAR